jgi:hypothetical protein
MTPDKEDDIIEAKAWLTFATRDLAHVINYFGSDASDDIRCRDDYYRAAIRSLEEACALLGIEVVIPALEEKL